MNWPDIKAEWTVVKKAPVSFVVMVIATVSLSWFVASKYYEGRLQTSQALIQLKDEEIKRYRTALGLQEGQSSLISLTNEELRVKAKAIVAKLRTFRQRVSDRWGNVEKEMAREKDASRRRDLRQKAEQENGKDFAECCRAEAMNIRAELRARLPKNVPASHTPFGLLVSLAGGQQLLLTPMDILPAEQAYLLTDALANEIEQLAALL